MAGSPREQNTACGSDEHAEARHRARPWRRLTVLGGLTLAACFFLPAIKACNSDVVPSEGLVEAVSEFRRYPVSLESVAEHVVQILAFLPAYLTGLLLATAALTRLFGRRGWNRVAGMILLLVVAGTAALLLSLFGYLVAAEGPPAPDEWAVYSIYVVGPAVALIYLLLAKRGPERLGTAAAFIACLWLLCWFGGWVVLSYSDCRYGVELSCAAAGLLLLATIGEARAVTGQTWRRTTWQLAAARLAKSREVRGRCPQCEYFLYGLTEMRCPECGRPFTFEELGVSGREIGFQGSSDQ